VELKMTQGSNFRLKCPVHPGSFVRTEIFQASRISVGKAAAVLGVSPKSLSAFLAGNAPLSPNLALRIEMAFGVSRHTLLRMQNSHDVAQRK
jgi:addiction module HigA family antidote